MRKKNSLLNFITSFVPFVVLMFFGFWKVNVWQTKLGEDIFALNQLFFQLFAYLSLLEAGIGALVQKEYYKLLAIDDKEKICKYYTLSKKMLRIVACLIVFIGFLLSFFLDELANDSLLSLPYMQLVFMIFLAKSVVDYIFCSPRYILQADQKLYKINILLNIYRIFEAFVEVYLIMYGFGYLTVLIATLIVRIVLNLHVNKKIYREYPWLKTVDECGQLKITGMKDVVLYKVVTAVQDNTDIMLISAFINPLTVTIYSSYNYITKYLNDFIYIVGTALTSSLGNLMYTKDRSETIPTFELINALFFFISSVLTTILFLVTNSFIALWVGSDKIISNIPFICILFIFFHNVARRPLLILKDVFALYKETQVVFIAEAGINFVLSFLTVSKYGISGVLVSSVISIFIANFYFFPKLMYKEVFNVSCKGYIGKYCFSLLFTILLSIICSNFISFTNVNNFLMWFVYSCVVGIVVLLISFFVFYSLFDDFRKLSHEGFRFVSSLLNKRK